MSGFFVFMRTVIAAAACALQAGCWETSEAHTSSLKVAAATPRLSTTTASGAIRGTCTIRPENVVRLKSRIGGEISKVAVVQGDSVGEGQVLANIDTSELELRRQRAVLDLERTSQRIEWLKYQVLRSQKQVEAATVRASSEKPYVPEFGSDMAAFREKSHDLHDAEVSLRLGQLDVRTIEQQIEKAKIRSPLRGVILSRGAEPGMVVGSGSDGYSGGDVLFEVADPRQLLAVCVVRESDSSGLMPADKVTLVIDGHEDRPVSMAIHTVAPVITNDAGISRREFNLRLKAVDVPFKVVPGMNGIVKIEERT